MSRAKGGVITRHRHKKILAAAKGFQGTNNRLYKRASDAVLHAGEYAFAGRNQRARDFRRLWISRINVALKPFELRYSEFIKKLVTAKIELDRKVLADLAVNAPSAFEAVVRKIV